jgi:hypothetical protein
MFAGRGAYNPYAEGERGRIKALLGQYDSHVLESDAERWGIEIPHNEDKPDWYSEKIKNPDPDNLPGGTINLVGDYLNDRGRTMVGKQVRDAKFAYWKGWADLLVPILALAVAFLALFKDVIVAYIQTHR